MAKKKRRSKTKAFPEFPPDIFWISPDGKYRDVIGHVTSLQAHPEAYGLPGSPRGKDEIQDALGDLFLQGWVRGRYSAGTFSFQMERPRGTPMGNAYDFILLFESYAKEVDVDFWNPSYKPMGKSMTAREFMAQRFPARWGLGRRDDPGWTPWDR